MNNDRNAETKTARPLSQVKSGTTVTLVGIDAGRGLNNRLASMGLVANTRIKVVSNNHPGPFVISVKDTKMVLGRGMAAKIMVV